LIVLIENIAILRKVVLSLLQAVGDGIEDGAQNDIDLVFGHLIVG